MNQLTVSLWRDEAFSALLAKHSLLDILNITIHDTAPPLYHFILHFWIKIFGFGEVGLRSLSLVAFVLLCFSVYFFAKEVFKSKRIGIFAAILTLVNPFIFLYAFEARMYMLLLLFTVLSMWFFVTKRWVLYILATLAVLYTHNFGLFIVLTQIVSFLISNFSKESLSNQLKSPFLRSILVVFVFYAPWIPILYNQTFKVTDSFWISKPDIFSFGNLLIKFIEGSDKFVGSVTVILIAIVLLLLRGFRKNTDTIFYSWLLFAPLITFILSQFIRPIFFDRYLIISSPAIPFLLASQLKNDWFSKCLKKVQVSTILLLVMVVLLFFANVNSFNNPTKQPFKELVGFVNGNYGKDQMVINYYNNVLHYFELKYYGANVKIYSKDPIPFWNGTALLDNNDVLKQIPTQEKILVMVSGGNVEKIQIPNYNEINRRKFNDLYLLWFVKETNGKI
jgi:mannosyltransferase